MRLIDADALKIDYGFTWDDITPTHKEMYSLIDRQPTIEKRKKGRWIGTVEDWRNQIVWWGCSECGMDISTRYNYCPDCGADMRKEENEQSK